MAYLDLSLPRDDTRVATARDAGLFSPTELRVIGLAERFDATREIVPHSRLGRFVEWALGIRLGRPLADPRLESLRRFASLARHHVDQLGRADIDRLVEAGFSTAQAYGLLAYLGASAPTPAA